MKVILVVLVTGLLFSVLGYIVGGKSDSSSSTKVSETDTRPSALRTNRLPLKDSAQIQQRVISSLDKTGGRNLLKSAQDIFQLNSKEIETLLQEPQFKNVSYYGGANSQLFSTCFTRLAEINPENALRLSETLNEQQKYVAVAAIYQEWSSSDPEGALASALELKSPQQKQTSLYFVLNALSLVDPEKAFDLAQEHKATSSLSAILVNMANTDPISALKKCDSLSAQQQSWMRSRIISTWATKDSDEALAYIDQIENKAERSQAMLGLISSYATEDIDKAIELLDSNPDAANSDQMYSVIHQLAQTDPKRTIDWITNSYQGDKKDNLLSNAISNWFQSDEDAALTYYNGIENKDQKKAVSKSILSSLSHSDPKKFLKLYETMGADNDDNDWSYKNAVAKIAETDLDFAKKHLESITDPKLRKEALESVLKGLAKHDPEAAIQMVDGIQDPIEKQAALGSLYDSLADKDPGLVAEAFIEGGYKKFGEYEVDDFVYDYARKDLTAAQAFVESIQDPLIWNDSVKRLLSKWSETAPMEAALYAFQQDPTAGIESSMWSIGRALAKEDPQEAMTLAMSQPKNSISEKLLRSALDYMVKDDLAGTVATLQTLPAEWAGTQIYNTIGRQYGETDPQQGLQWANSLSDEKNRNNAAKSIINKWINTDPDSAAKHINTMQTGTQRDDVVKNLVNKFDDSEPAYALEWADSISNEKQRRSRMKSTYNSWKKRDPQGADNWIRSTNLLQQETKDQWSK